LIWLNGGRRFRCRNDGLGNLWSGRTMPRARKLDVTTALTTVPLLRELTAEQAAELARGTEVLRVGRNTVLFDKGDAPTGVYIVLFGQVKLALTSSSGEEKVLQIFGPGSSFGEAVLFLERGYPVRAQALGDAMLLKVSREALFEAIDANPGLARRMLGGLSARLHDLVHDVEAYSMRSSAQRLVGYLLHLSAGSDGGTAIALPTTKHVVASRLNLTAETLSRVLHALVEEGLIEVEGRRITIHDIDRLRSYA
jgi:CRP-like cAMP-binding protein